MDAREFWGAVAEETTKLKVELAKGSNDAQPNVDEGVCYIVSKRSRTKGTTAGSVVLAAHRLAAQRIVEETHELASEEQITEYLAGRSHEAEAIRQKDLSRKAQVVVHVDEKMRPLNRRGAAAQD